jgi:hypothetical protein
LERDFLGQPEENSFAKFTRFIGKVNESLAGKKLIILFDEYEIFESHIDKGMISTEVLHLLGNWIDYKGGAFIVFTGSDRLDERTAPYWSGFLTKALYRGVSYLSKSDTLRLILEPVEGAVDYVDDVPEKIWTLTAGQAFYTQVYCQALVDHLNECRVREVTAEDLQEVTDKIIVNPLPQMIFSWNSMLPMEKVALSIIGAISRDEIKPVSAKDILAFANAEKIGYDIDPGKLNETLEKLFHHDLLDKDSESAYTFRMDLWRQWIARMQSIWKVVREIADSDEDIGEGLTKSQPRRAWMRVVIPAVLTVAVAAYMVIDRNTGASGRLPLAPPVDSTTVSIRTVPPGAWIYLNERRVDRSPIVNMMAAVGPTPVRIELDGYRDVADTLNLHKDVPLDTSFALAQRVGNITVTSSPKGADILLDGERTGLRTPGTLERLAVTDFHRIGLELSSYTGYEWPGVAAIEDTTITLDHVFTRLKSQITFDTQPSGAEIVVDGATRGTTPAVIVLEYGRHDVAFRLGGYGVVTKTITVASADQTIREKLDKLPPGRLVVKILPYADVYIDGVLQSSEQSRFEVSLDAGRHEIELRNPHFATRSFTVEIESNGTAEKTVDMRTKESE